LRLESYDGLSQVHNGTVRTNRPPDDVVRVLEIDDDCLGGGVGIGDLAYANILVGLECLYVLSANLSEGRRQT
jgi:hypothetical protein